MIIKRIVWRICWLNEVGLGGGPRFRARGVDGGGMYLGSEKPLYATSYVHIGGDMGGGG